MIELKQSEFIDLNQFLDYDFTLKSRIQEYKYIEKDGTYGWREVFRKNEFVEIPHTPYALKAIISKNNSINENENEDEYGIPRNTVIDNYRVGMCKKPKSKYIRIDIDKHNTDKYSDVINSYKFLMDLFEIQKPTAMEIGNSKGLHLHIKCDEDPTELISLLKEYLKANEIKNVEIKDMMVLFNCCKYTPIKEFNDGNVEYYESSEELMEDIKFSRSIVSVQTILSKLPTKKEKKKIKVVINKSSNKLLNNIYNKYKNVKFGEGTRQYILFEEPALARKYRNALVRLGYTGEELDEQWEAWINLHHDESNPSKDWQSDCCRRAYSESLDRTYNDEMNYYCSGVTELEIEKQDTYFDNTKHIYNSEYKYLQKSIHKLRDQLWHYRNDYLTPVYHKYKNTDKTKEDYRFIEMVLTEIVGRIYYTFQKKDCLDVSLVNSRDTWKKFMKTHNFKGKHFLLWAKEIEHIIAYNLNFYSKTTKHCTFDFGHSKRKGIIDYNATNEQYKTVFERLNNKLNLIINNLINNQKERIKEIITTNRESIESFFFSLLSFFSLYSPLLMNTLRIKFFLYIIILQQFISGRYINHIELIENTS